MKRISKTEGWKKQTFFCCQKVNFDAKISLVFFAVTAINFMCIEHSAKLAKVFQVETKQITLKNISKSIFLNV